MIKKVVSFFLILGALAILGCGAIYWKLKHAESVHPPGDKAQGFFYIHSGTGFQGVRDSLIKLGWVTQPRLFDLAARLAKYPESVKPGKYLLKREMSFSDLSHALKSGKTVDAKFSLRQVRFPEDLAGILGRYTEADSMAIIKLLNDSVFVSQWNVTPTNVLSAFVSNTYQLDWAGTPKVILERLQKACFAFWTEQKKSQAILTAMTIPEITSLAAIVQEETVKKDEAPRIAGLYLNRLKKKMLLQSDPTVKYARLALNRDDKIGRVYMSATKTDHPSNTYKYKGLPPAPIILPEPWAIEAVLKPITHNYIFMVARVEPKRDGYHVFTNTQGEHEKYAAKWHAYANREGLR